MSDEAPQASQPASSCGSFVPPGGGAVNLGALSNQGHAKNRHVTVSIASLRSLEICADFADGEATPPNQDRREVARSRKMPCPGDNVYPRRVEETIHQHPAVEEMTVAGIEGKTC